MLYPVTNDLPSLPFCGPTAISSITGRLISSVEDCIKKSTINPRQRVTSLGVNRVIHCLRLFGWSVKKEIDWYGKDKIKPIEFESLFRDGPYLLLTQSPAHFVAYSEGEFLDTSNDYPQIFNNWDGRDQPHNQLIESAYRLELRRNK